MNLYHTTSLNGLYEILKSGYIKSRNTSGAEVGFSPVHNAESGNWVYLTLDPKLPGVGNLSVQLVLSGQVLFDRDDYYLNKTWSYGKTEDSLPANKLEEFVKFIGPYSEIIFPNEIPIQSYLISINIVQQPQHILEKIPIEYRSPIIDYDRIPIPYKKLIKIVEKNTN